MSRQTPRPLEPHTLRTADRSPLDIVAALRGTTPDLGLDPDYQRGDVWTEDQRIALIRSWLTGTPTGIVILSDRTTPQWSAANGYDPAARGEPLYAVIDGRQRITTARLWADGELAVPASWFPASDVALTEDTDDGPYVRYPGLHEAGRRKFANRAHLPVATVKVATLAEEATVYLLVNGGGTPQSAGDLDRAGSVAPTVRKAAP